jgi:hypothetical protein
MFWTLATPTKNIQISSLKKTARMGSKKKKKRYRRSMFTKKRSGVGLKSIICYKLNGRWVESIRDRGYYRNGSFLQGMLEEADRVLRQERAFSCEMALEEVAMDPSYQRELADSRFWEVAGAENHYIVRF